MVANWKVWDGAAFHPATKIRRWNGVSWDEVQRIRRWTVNGDGTLSWQDVYIKGGTTPPPSPPPSPAPPPPPPPVVLNVTASPSPTGGTRVGVGVTDAAPVTVSVSNGTPPYNYLFARSSYTAPSAPTIAIDPTNPNIATFSQDIEVVPDTESGVFTCTVTDANGNRGSASINSVWNTVAQGGTGGQGYKVPKSFDGTSLP